MLVQNLKFFAIEFGDVPMFCVPPRLLEVRVTQVPVAWGGMRQVLTIEIAENKKRTKQDKCQHLRSLSPITGRAQICAMGREMYE